MVILHDVGFVVFRNDNSTSFMHIVVSVMACVIMYGCQTWQKVVAFMVTVTWPALSPIFTSNFGGF